MADTASLVLYDPRTADPEVIALAGYARRTREAYNWTCASSSSSPGARSASCACSTPTAVTSRCTPGSSKSAARRVARLRTRCSTSYGVDRRFASRSLSRRSGRIGHVERQRVMRHLPVRRRPVRVLLVAVDSF